MARFSLVGFAVSVALHGLAYASLGLAPRKSRPPRAPASVFFEATGPAPRVEPRPEVEPPKAPEPEPMERPRSPARAPSVPLEPPPEQPRPAPFDLSGVTLSNSEGLGSFSMPSGDGSSRNGPLAPLAGRERAESPVPRTSASTETRRSAAPSLVSSGDLSRRPVPPRLDAALRSFYPDDARRRGLSGTASLRVRIDADGVVRKTSILNESFAGFGAACRKAVLGSGWSAPLDRDGRAVPTEVRYTCRFVVE